MDTTGRFRQTAPDQLQLREGGGCLSLFGLPFLAAGIFVTLIGLGIVPVSNAAALPGWAWPLILLMGLVFVAVGGGLVFGRRWVTLDAGRRTVRTQWGLLLPLRGEERSLQGYDALLLRFEAGDSDSADRYPLLLRATAGGADLPLASSTQYGESREQAAAVARLLGLPLVDATTDHQAVSAAERVDATLQERLQAGEERTEEAPRPLRMRSVVRESSRGVEIVLPGPGFRPASLVGLAVSAGILTYVSPGLLEFFRRTRTPEGVQMIFFAVVLLFLLVLPLCSLAKAVALARRGRTLVTASPEGIVVEERTAWRTAITRIPAGDILGLDYGTAETAFQVARRSAEERAARAGRPLPGIPGPGREPPPWLLLVRRLGTSKGVIVKSRTRLFALGAGLPDEEIRYLHTAIGRALGGAHGGRW